MKKILLRIVASASLLWFAPGVLASSAEVSSFSPQGEVKGVRQIRVGFSESMVPFGDPRPKKDPMDVECSDRTLQPGSGKTVTRWADTRNWILDFGSELPAGVKCSFRLRSGLTALSGTPVEALKGGSGGYGFSTGGPAILQQRPWEGNRVQEDQAFVLELDSDVTEDSVLSNVKFQVEGIQEPIESKFLTGRERDEVLKSAFPSYRWNREEEAGKKHFRIVIQANRRFPPDKKISLVWGKGISTPSGVQSTRDQTLHYQVRPEFTARFSCERENAAAACIPFTAMRLDFTAPVLRKDLARIRLKSQSGTQEWKLKESSGASSEEGGAGDDRSTQFASFQGPFPENSKFRIEIPANIEDETGRKLLNASSFPLEATTAAYPPLAKFAAGFGIVELTPEAAVPVTLRSLEPLVEGQVAIEGELLRVDGSRVGNIIDWIAKVRKQGEWEERGRSVFTPQALKDSGGMGIKSLNVPKPGGAKAFEVVGIPLPKPGFYVVELSSRILGASLLGVSPPQLARPMFVSSAVLVTDLSVHFKQGRESSIAWVTRLGTGRPVADAALIVRDCTGKALAHAKSDSQGIARFGTFNDSHAHCNARGEYSPLGSGLFVTAQSGEDFSFVHTSWKEGIESWRFNLPSSDASQPNLAHSVLDRSLFRAGETVHMKHFVRAHAMNGLVPVARNLLPRIVQIRHLGSNSRYELPLDWSPGDTALSQWSIPKDAKLGTYSIRLLQSGKVTDKGDGEEGSEAGWYSGSFRVEEYRVPLMKATIQPPRENLVAVPEVDLDLAVEFLAGGGAAKLPVLVRRVQTPSSGAVIPGSSELEPGFEGVVFGNGPAVREGDENSPDPVDSKPKTQSLVLDGRGTARVKLADLTPSPTGSDLLVELEYKDPSGAIQTVSQSLKIHPSGRQVGILPDSWFASIQSLKFKAAVVDLSGTPVRGAPVEVDLFESKTYSHRKKLVGGFYAYENRHELLKLGRSCSGKTDEHGILSCDIAPPKAGNLILQARTEDERGRESLAHSSTWVYDKADWWFEQGDSDRIDVISEKKRYEPGEKAVFQVRMPFREATALITVEREGVIEAFTRPLSGRKPLVEVPILPSYAPNVFVSVLVVRGRAGEIQPTALVDLGKPAYKLGIAEIQVGWKTHELRVQVKADHEVYPVRGKASVRIQVTAVDGSKLAAGSEIALAAVDEGLLQLKPNESWKLLDRMMDRRGYEVETSTAQSQVVGKRHFGLKAVPMGGDGGKAPTRELFDTLLLWKGRVALDSRGQAQVEVPLNDSVTAFRIVAVAHSGASRFGMGSALIRTSQDLMIFAGVSPIAREGDRFPAGITIRNTTSSPMTVEVSGRAVANGTLDQPASAPLPMANWTPRTLELPAGESRLVRFPIEVPRGAAQITYEWRAHAGACEDKLKFVQKVVPAVPVRTYQATLAQVEGDWRLPVQIPEGASPGLGGVRVQLGSSLAPSLTGVRDYMRAYPYSGMEQKTSRAIVLQDEAMWKRNMAELPAYLDADGLVKYFPGQWTQGSEVLTAYLVSIAHEASFRGTGWSIPDPLLNRMIGGLRGFVEGRFQRSSSIETADLTLRKLAAFEALARQSQGRWSQISGLEFNPNLWPTSSLLDWVSILRRTPDVPDSKAKLTEAFQILRSRLNFQGTTMGFSTDRSDDLWWLMVSVDSNANRLLLSTLDQAGWKDELPRIARGAVFRQKRGHWDTTPANAWGVLAIERFVQAFEREPLSGETLARLGEASGRTAWVSSPRGNTFDFDWPGGKTSGKAPITLHVQHQGGGKPWALVQSRAAIPLKEALSSGYRIQKSWQAVERKHSGQWSQGDVVRIRLECEAQADMTWVVIEDPLPAGAQILGTGLGGDSGIGIRGEKREGGVWPAYEERSFESFRAYYSFVPKGKWTVEYTFRLNQDGVMGMPPTRLEAMYAPEMFGESPNEMLKVSE